jgi:adenosylcobinamide-phosphate synthase
MIELSALQIIIVLIIAAGIDLIFGDPPNAFHPVAWLGKVISLEIKLTPRNGKIRQLLFGTIIVLFTTGIILALLYLFEYYVKDLNVIVYTACVAVLLKFTFSVNGLKKTVSVIKLSVMQGDLDKARKELQALVSRETEHLDKKQIVSAVIVLLRRSFTSLSSDCPAQQHTALSTHSTR